MFGIAFTSVLVLILLWKINKVLKNKRSSSYFEDIDDEFIIMLNEGDQID